MRGFLKWSARLSGAVIAAALLVFLAAHIVNPDESARPPTPTEWILLALFPAGICIGYLAGWQWPLVGG